jgi:hypothetical protein
MALMLLVDVPFPCLLHAPGVVKVDSEPSGFLGAQQVKEQRQCTLWPVNDCESKHNNQN